jgi:tRNA pseudouridine synthase 10
MFLAGRYNKYSRSMSQTPWLLDTGRKTQNSVEEVICLNAKEWIKAKDYRFASSGREDVDVRMLGRGRPFVVEFIDPRKETFTTEDMGAIQKQINATTPDVQVRDLQLVSRADTQILKTGETEKVKKYSAICYATRSLTEEDLVKMNAINDLVLHQTTPIRVLHRRPLAVRDRSVFDVRAERVEGSSSHFKLSLSSQAGTYIKEFVHGDFGRTTPNLGELLQAECDILELDVEDVMLDWPQQIDYPA